MTEVDLDLIGRQSEQAVLDQMLAAIDSGRGGIVLLAGEAGVGKTRLLEACLSRSGLLAIRGQTNEIATPPYGPIAAALRAYLRAYPDGLASCGPLAPYLALLLSELGIHEPGGAGSTNLKQAPPLYSESYQIAPPCISTISLQMANPRPVPPCLLTALRSTW